MCGRFTKEEIYIYGTKFRENLPWNDSMLPAMYQHCFCDRRLGDGGSSSHFHRSRNRPLPSSEKERWCCTRQE